VLLGSSDVVEHLIHVHHRHLLDGDLRDDMKADVMIEYLERELHTNSKNTAAL
jgi:hypothetical protein